MRRFTMVCVAIVLAATCGWWLHEAAEVLEKASQESISRDLAQARQALRQEREKTEQLERRLAGAPRGSTALATVAADSPALRQELTDLRGSLEEERMRTATLARDLETARQAGTTAAGEGAQALEEHQRARRQERERADGLERELAAARREIEVQATALKKATGDQQQIAELQTTLQEERRKAEETRREVETQAALLKKAADKSTEKQQIAELQAALQEERRKAEETRREVETQAAVLKKAADKSTEKQQIAELQRTLREEHAKAEAARREAEVQTKKAAGKSRQLADLENALREERGKAEEAARDLAAVQARATAKPAEDPQTVELRKELKQERDKAQGLARELATARREIEAHAAALAKAADRTAENHQLTELRHTLQQERARTDALTRELAMASATVGDNKRVQKQLIEVQQPLRQSDPEREGLALASRSQPVAPPKAQPPKPSAAHDTASASALRDSKDAEIRRLMLRAQQLVEQRNISAARNMFERAADSGSAEALFALAETYDPKSLAAWGTVGTQGDLLKAEELYRRALAAGIGDADARLKSLRP